MSGAGPDPDVSTFLIRRLGALALLAVIIALVGHLPSTARWLAPAMPAAAPTWTLITECRIERRLSRELEKLNAATHLIEDDPPPDII